MNRTAIGNHLDLRMVKEWLHQKVRRNGEKKRHRIQIPTSSHSFDSPPNVLERKKENEKLRGRKWILPCVCVQLSLILWIVQFLGLCFHKNKPNSMSIGKCRIFVSNCKFPWNIYHETGFGFYYVPISISFMYIDIHTVRRARVVPMAPGLAHQTLEICQKLFIVCWCLYV